mmetsp:Transcript_3850/g.6777  ORF Transcript_3850/g.6777 Transcript_3850/m.6777 type:complete len:707 (-) Transcript_3850:206-2326(-)
MHMASPIDRLDMMEQELMQMKSMRNNMQMMPMAGLQMMQSQSAGMLPPLNQTQQPQVVHIHEGGNGGTSSGGGVDTAQHQEIMKAHKEMLNALKETQSSHSQLLLQHRDLEKQHGDLLKAHKDLIQKMATMSTGGKGAAAKKKAKAPSLGVVRLDYNYPPAAGDTDSPASYGYDVFYRATPGLTFEAAQAGQFSEEVERRFAESIKYLEARGVNAITGDCGFMMAFQILARKIASKPVFMSSMVQCPVIEAAMAKDDKILILTANGDSLRDQKQVLLRECGFDCTDGKFIIRGCQDIPGFDAVAKGLKVPLEIVQPGVVKMVKAILKRNPKISAILMECSELPAYSDALRYHTGLPVWDAITACDFYISAFQDNPRFGVGDWQESWDGEQEEYEFGKHLTKDDQQKLVNKVTEQARKKEKAKKHKNALDKVTKSVAKTSFPKLGILRLDYNYPPSAGDVDCPASYGYDLLYRSVPGFTFEMCQSGKLSPTVEKDFIAALKWLEKKGASIITGDCGFMMAFQPIARDVVKVPVFMSSMVQCPMISVAFDKYDKILILTANDATLKPQKETLLSHCGFDVDDNRFVIRGCQDVPGFDAVAKGEKVNVEYVTPGIVKMVKKLLEQFPTIRAINLECSELPPYADALRQETKLPVFDAITAADYFISARQDNPRFGFNQWQCDWDGEHDEYELGDNLSDSELARMESLGR